MQTMAYNQASDCDNNNYGISVGDPIKTQLTVIDSDNTKIILEFDKTEFGSSVLHHKLEFIDAVTNPIELSNKVCGYLKYEFNEIIGYMPLFEAMNRSQ